MKRLAQIVIVLLGGYLLMKKFSPQLLDDGQELVIRKIAYAVANAEGFNISGSRPARDHNPGDLTLDLGAANPAVGMDGMFVIFATDEDGWANLIQEVRGWFGTSAIYNDSMTLAQVAGLYSPDGSSTWASNVASYLGVTVDTPLSQIV